MLTHVITAGDAPFHQRVGKADPPLTVPRPPLIQQGLIMCVTAVGTMAGVIVYYRVLKSWRYRSIFALAQLLMFAATSLDVVLVTRLNLRLGVPDAVFVLGDEVSQSRGGRSKSATASDC
jgi:hypothetical protein